MVSIETPNNLFVDYTQDGNSADNLLMEDVKARSFGAWNTTRMQNARFRRCVVSGSFNGSAHNQGMFLGGTDTVTIEAVRLRPQRLQGEPRRRDDVDRWRGVRTVRRRTACRNRRAADTDVLRPQSVPEFLRLDDSSREHRQSRRRRQQRADARRRPCRAKPVHLERVGPWMSTHSPIRLATRDRSSRTTWCCTTTASCLRADGGRASVLAVPTTILPLSMETSWRTSIAATMAGRALECPESRTTRLPSLPRS